MKSGDILFYKPRGAQPISRLIAWYTGGKYCHVEVVISDTESIGALASGITRHAIPAPDAVASLHLDSEGLAVGLNWLNAQVGDPYGFADIADAAFGHILKHLPLLLVQPKAYDCSDLATRFLIAARVKLPSELSSVPSLVSPNDLARYFGV